MTLAIDSQESGATGHRSLSSPLTWVFTNTAGNLLLVGIVATSTTGTPAITAVTYGGVAMSLVTSVTWDTAHSLAAMYVLVNPATGANTVSITATGVDNSILGGAKSYSGGDTTTPTGTTSTNTDAGTAGTHATAGNITAASGNYVLGVGGWGAGAAATADTGETLTFSLVGSGNTAGDDIASPYKQSAGAAINAGFTWTGADKWGMVASEIRAATGGAAAATPNPIIVPSRAAMSLSGWW